MAKLGLAIRPGIEEALTLGRAVIDWAFEHKHEPILEAETAQMLGKSAVVMSAEQLVQKVDPIVVLGGDGTLIGLARYVGQKSPVFIGVNFGQLGFLTEVSPVQVISTLESVFSGNAQFAERSLLHAEVLRNGKRIFSSQAVNDVVVQKAAEDKLLSLDIGVNGDEVMRLRADGVIIATPTGSTAYSLAAGGSIVYPLLSVMLLTPICAHSLTSRPLVLPLDSGITVSIPPYDGKVIVSVDGQVSEALHTSDVVKVVRSKNNVRFVKSPTKSYFEILRTKLNWGIANKSE